MLLSRGIHNPWNYWIIVSIQLCTYNKLSTAERMSIQFFTGEFCPPKKLWNHVHIYLCWTIFKGYIIWRNIYIKNMNVVLHIINAAFVS